MEKEKVVALTKNVQLPKGHTQVCVWKATELGSNTPEDFEKFIASEFNGTRAKFLEIILTNPDPGDDESGGRSDLFFSVNSDDLGKFSVPRLAYGIRWIEDVYGNGGGYLYPSRIAKYKSW